MGDAAFTQILAWLMVGLTLYTLWDPLGKQQGQNRGRARPRPRRALVAAGFFLVGGQLGVRFTVLKGHRWVKGVVTLAVNALALKLLITG